jgi:hypothetical protein
VRASVQTRIHCRRRRRRRCRRRRRRSATSGSLLANIYAIRRALISVSTSARPTRSTAKGFHHTNASNRSAARIVKAARTSRERCWLKCWGCCIRWKRRWHYRRTGSGSGCRLRSMRRFWGWSRRRLWSRVRCRLWRRCWRFLFASLRCATT